MVIKNALLLILLLVWVSLSLCLICSLLGFWDTTQIKRLLWPRIPLICLLLSVVGCEIWLVAQSIEVYSRM